LLLAARKTAAGGGYGGSGAAAPAAFDDADAACPCWKCASSTESMPFSISRFNALLALLRSVAMLSFATLMNL